MTEIERLKAEIAKIEHGAWVSTTLHDIAAAAKALIHKIEGELHGDHDQEVAQGAAAQEAGHSAGAEDTGGETGGGSEVKESGAA